LQGRGNRERKTKREKRERDSELPERVVASFINLAVSQIPKSSMAYNSPETNCTNKMTIIIIQAF
jgi:hypothetical protein